jgi:hypothetical protein
LRSPSAAFRLVRKSLVGLIRDGQAAGELAPGDPEVLAELALRLGASFVLIPESVLPLQDPAATREAVRSLIAPALPQRSARIGRHPALPTLTGPSLQCWRC